MTPSQMFIGTMLVATLGPFLLIFVRLDELLIWVGIGVICTYVKVASKF